MLAYFLTEEAQLGAPFANENYVVSETDSLKRRSLFRLLIRNDLNKLIWIASCSDALHASDHIVAGSGTYTNPKFNERMAGLNV